MQELLASPVPEQQQGDPKSSNVWERCMGIIKKEISPRSFKTWFEPIVPLYLKDDHTLVVQIPSQFFYDWLEEHYNQLIRRSITETMGADARLYYRIAAELPQDAHQPEPPQPQALPTPSEPFGYSPAYFRFNPRLNVSGGANAAIQINLNPRYQFENFIKGESNQLARAAAMAVANNPGGTTFNPLVVYGGSGLGKTHLISALANHAFNQTKARRVAYLTSERFTTEFVDAMKDDKLNEFSHFYRSLDLLVVDDIQFLAGKERMQDSFFHTFNALYQLGKQIVLSSDTPPKEIKGLDERLLSRFQSGLTVDIQPPDLETRIAILKKKSEENGLILTSEVGEYIAANVTTNVRELEGCLIRLLAATSLEQKEITLDIAAQVLKAVVKDVRTPITIEQIQRIVSKYHQIPEDMIRAKTRRHEIVMARQIAMYLAKELTHSSLKTIGLHFGGRDHSTVIHAYQTVEENLRTDTAFKQTVEDLKRLVMRRGG
jgi:chromosomal replication initiator protein